MRGAQSDSLGWERPVPQPEGKRGCGKGLVQEAGGRQGWAEPGNSPGPGGEAWCGGQPQGASFHARDRVFILMDILKNTDVLWIRDPKPKGPIRYALWVFPLGDQ